MSAITFFVSFQLSIFLVVSFVLSVSVPVISVLVVFVVLIVLVLVVLVVSVLLVVHNFTPSLGFENSFCSLSKTIPVSPTGN